MLFQAIITLLIGLIFLMQMFSLEKVNLNDLVQDSVDKEYENIVEIPAVQSFVDLKVRFQRASYILIIVALIEWILITRLLDQPVEEFKNEMSIKN